MKEKGLLDKSMTELMSGGGKGSGSLTGFLGQQMGLQRKMMADYVNSTTMDRLHGRGGAFSADQIAVTGILTQTGGLHQAKLAALQMEEQRARQPSQVDPFGGVGGDTYNVVNNNNGGGGEGGAPTSLALAVQKARHNPDAKGKIDLFAGM